MSGQNGPFLLPLTGAAAHLVAEAEAAERAGNRELAWLQYDRALRLLRESGAASTILRRIARSYCDDGQLDVALDCLDAALGSAEAHGALSDIAHARNLAGNILLTRGDYAAAEPMYARALALAVETGERQLEAMVAQNLGVIASMRGDLPAALERYAASLVVYRMLGMQRQVGHALNNMALVYTHLGRLVEAQAAYDEAIVLCRAAGDVPHRLLALTNAARLHLVRGDMNAAEALCQSVLSEATDAGDERALGETFKHLGVIARARGDYDSAERHLVAAYDNAIRREDLLLAGETAREQAELFELMNKNRETLQALTQSHRLFTKLESQRNLAELQERVERLEERFYLVVARWAGSIESKDSYLRGHCERVADYACDLARDIGFDEMTMFWFRIGALLHDVGKISVPMEILNKPGRLTTREREVMERHAAAGAELLADIDFPWDILPMVRNHHERWDGAGYPDGIAGENIALVARIVCIADVFDALTTDRPYRPAFSRDEALTMMNNDRGKIFDPYLLTRFNRIVQEPPVISRRRRGRVSFGARRRGAGAPSSAA
ncbi:MAG TPA: HD domain-containing phosphohydrolase [Gemmatimonadaceae bacterium]